VYILSSSRARGVQYFKSTHEPLPLSIPKIVIFSKHVFNPHTVNEKLSPCVPCLRKVLRAKRNFLQKWALEMLQVCCSVLQYIAVCYSVLQCVALWNTLWCTGGGGITQITRITRCRPIPHSPCCSTLQRPRQHCSFLRPTPRCTETYIDTHTYSHTHRHIYMDTHP